MVGLRMVVVGLLIYHRIPAARWGGVEAGDAILDVTGGGLAFGCGGAQGVCGVSGQRDLRLVSPAATVASLGWSPAWGPDTSKTYLLSRTLLLLFCL
jgi:hypothetical protein